MSNPLPHSKASLASSLIFRGGAPDFTENNSNSDMALSERNIRTKLTATFLATFLSLSVFASSSSSHASPVLQGERGSSLRPLGGCQERSRTMVPGCKFRVQMQMQRFQMLAKRRHLTPPPAPVLDRPGHYKFICTPPPPNSPPLPPAITRRDPGAKMPECAPPPPPHC